MTILFQKHLLYRPFSFLAWHFGQSFLDDLKRALSTRRRISIWPRALVDNAIIERRKVFGDSFHAPRLLSGKTSGAFICASSGIFRHVRAAMKCDDDVMLMTSAHGFRPLGLPIRQGASTAALSHCRFADSLSGVADDMPKTSQ